MFVFPFSFFFFGFLPANDMRWKATDTRAFATGLDSFSAVETGDENSSHS